MLRFAFAYSDPINKITGDRSMKVRQYEIKDDEWRIVEQLRDCLKVRTIFHFIILLSHIILDIQNGNRGILN
jgi:hypothetical protein